MQGALLKKIIKFLASWATFFPSVAGTLQKHATCSHQANLLVKMFNYKVTSSLIFTNLIKPTGLRPKQYRVPNVHQLLTGYSPRTVQSRTVVLQLINSFSNSFCVRILTGFFLLNYFPAAQDCILSPWSSWSKCSEQCGFGTMKRRRVILQAPKNDGKACPIRHEKKGCFQQNCKGNMGRFHKYKMYWQ